jgi:hypothetical protein
VRLVSIGQALAIPLAVVSIGSGAIHLSALPLYAAGGPAVVALFVGGGLFQMAWGLASR